MPVSALVDAVSDGEQVQFTVDPVGLAIQSGEARFVSVKVKARKRIWRGQPITYPFVVVVSPQDSSPVELDGSYVQTPVIPKWLLWALLALLLLLGALLALWFWLLKPTIQSQAEEAAQAAADAGPGGRGRRGDGGPAGGRRGQRRPAVRGRRRGRAPANRRPSRRRSPPTSARGSTW